MVTTVYATQISARSAVVVLTGGVQSQSSGWCLTANLLVSPVIVLATTYQIS